MRCRFLFPLVVLAFALPAFASRPCIAPAEAPDHPEKDICVTAHVYDVVEAKDGTRYLDVCRPEADDSACHFTIISLAEDRKEVGDLGSYREQDIRIRGVVHVMHGQSTILLSHARQFKDGAEKFHPNPTLMAGFSAGNAHTAFRDPAMSAKHHKSGTAFLGTTH